MKVYVINLDRRPDRLAFFTEQAHARGFEFLRIAAVDGAVPEFQDRVDAMSPSLITGEVLGPFQLACFESHRKAWQSFLESGDDAALIMEDDMIVSDDFAALLTDSWMPQDADLVRLEAGHDYGRFSRTPIATHTNRKLHRMYTTMLGSGAYVVSRKAAQVLVDASKQISDPVDEFLFNKNSPIFGQFTIYQMIPAPAIQGLSLNMIRPDGAGSWAVSSLEEERVELRVRPPASTRWRRYKIWWRVRYWRLRLRTWRPGTNYTKAPFG